MILVAGGTGTLGTLVVHRLWARGVPVRVLSRNRQRATHLPAGVEVVTGDVRDDEQVKSAVDGCAIVVSAIQGFVGPRGSSPASVDRDSNARLADAAAAQGAAVVLMSVVGAAATSPMELFRMKYAAEAHLRSSDVTATVIRATAFMETWVDLLRHTARRSGRPVIFGRGDNPINFVSVRDVAALVELVCIDPSSAGSTYEIGGPENLTLNQLADAVQNADHRAKTPRHVPRVALRFLSATVGRWAPQLGRQVRAAIAMDSIDLAFDGGDARARYPHLPRTGVADVLTGAR